MNDWNGNGKYDTSDSYMDYRMSNSGTLGASSDWWKWVLFVIMIGACPPIGIIFLIGILILDKSRLLLWDMTTVLCF